MKKNQLSNWKLNFKKILTNVLGYPEWGRGGGGGGMGGIFERLVSKRCPDG